MRAPVLLLVLLALCGCSTILRQVVSTPEFQGSYHMSRGMHYYDRRKFDAARDEFSLALEAQPDNYIGLEYRAASNEMLHNYRDAIVDLDHVEKVEPKDSVVKFRAQIIGMRAYAESNIRDYRAARLDYQRLIRIEPKDVSVREGIANALFIQGDDGAALATTDAAIKIAPRAATLYNDRCFYRAATPDLAGALADCNAVLDHRQTTSLRLHTLSSRALVYVKLARSTDAIADCNAALRISPSNPDALYLRGFAEAQQHDAGAARRDIAAALALRPALTTEYAVFRLDGSPG